MSNAELWDRLVNSKWPKDAPVPTPDEAVRGARRLMRVALGRKWSGQIKATTGNRNTWVRRGVLYVNPNERPRGGWPEIVHGIAHFAHMRRYPNDRPHSDRQAYIERDLVDYVLAHGFLTGALKSKAKPKPPRDLVAERYARMVKRLAKWEAKLLRAENAVVKLQRQIRTYERRHGDRVKGGPKC